MENRPSIAFRANGVTSGPSSIYEASIGRGEITADPAQAEAVSHLQRLYDDLTRPKPERGLLTRWLGSDSKTTLKGLYFWGGVGRGKTFLMDVFYDSLPFEEKRRMHFHRFMRYTHQQLRALQGTPNPLRQVAKNFAVNARVLCFDEFFVSDITDAMILAGVLDALFEEGVSLVATSNVEPSNLYKDGLQRPKFLPAIELLKKHTHILNVDGGVDYRLRALESAELFHFPLDSAADVSLGRSFSALSPDEGEVNVALEIEGRTLQARRCGDGVVWFDFPEICQGPRSQNDYIEIAMMFQTVLISNVPRFDSQKEDAARRFISLVDEFYDHNVKLILSAEVAVSELYAGDRFVFEFQRTESRLQEMQSNEYLGYEHLP
ncbi:MAG: cell division protein ZapE [Candidatus Azotimanducaceae bacterium]|jgi:cell division protein ZapE